MTDTKTTGPDGAYRLQAWAAVTPEGLVVWSVEDQKWLGPFTGPIAGLINEFDYLVAPPDANEPDILDDLRTAAAEGAGGLVERCLAEIERLRDQVDRLEGYIEWEE